MAGSEPRNPRFALGRLTDPALTAAVAAPAAVAALTLFFVIPTLAPGVASWDTAEFQTVAPVLGTGHPTGYPGYVILGWLASIVLQPFGDPAYRMNLLQALLAATAAAGTAGVVQVLTGRRLIAMATGLLLACSQLFWRLSTHADPHMFHVALVAILLVVLLLWEQRRHSKDPSVAAHADRWLVAAAFVYGVAVANHSLALLLPPAIGLFVLLVDWRVIFRPRTIAACVAVLVGTIVILFLEMPIRAAMNAPLVYGHPDTLSGFQYVVLAEQFRGSLADPFGDLPTKAGHVMGLITGWLGPLGVLAVLGLGTSLVRRPRYLVLSGLAAVVTCGFAASYANADIERYYLVPLLVAYTWIGLGAADAVTLLVWAAGEVRDALSGGSTEFETETDLAEASMQPAAARPTEPAVEPAEEPRGHHEGRLGWVLLTAEIVVAAAIAFTAIGVVPVRQQHEGSVAGAVSQAGNTSDSVWMHEVLAPADKGGLPKDAVIESMWNVSTTLWYGQKVLGLRPDILIVDDSTRKNDHIGVSGEVWDVFDLYLGTRPVFTDRFNGGCDGIVALSTAYEMKASDHSGIYQVVSRLEPHVSLGPCDPVRT